MSRKLGYLLLGGGIFGLCLVLIAGLAEAKSQTIDFLVWFIKDKNPALTDTQVQKIVENLLFWSKKRGLDKWLVTALIWQESWFDPFAYNEISKCKGLMQLKQIALDELKRVYKAEYSYERLYEIEHNIQAGTHFLYYAFHYPEEYTEFIAVARYRTPSRPEDSFWYAEEVLEKKQQILEALKNFKQRR